MENLDIRFTIYLKEINMYQGRAWRRFYGINGQDNEGQIYAKGAWRAFWPPDGVFLDGDWYVMKGATSGGTDPGTLDPEKKVNKIRIRKKDWIPSPGVFKFGLSLELTYSPAAEIWGQIKIKKGEKELSYDYNFLPGKVPYITYNSNEDANFDTIKFVSGTISRAEDDKYKYEFVHKKDDIIT